MPSIGPFVGPIPAELMKKVSEVVPRLEIRDIRLTGLSCQLITAPPLDQPVNVEMGHKVKADPIAEDSLGVKVRFNLAVKGTGEAAPEYLTISAVFQLTYQGADVKAITEEQRLAFANINAVFNAWPYLREIVQSISGRMSIPSLVVPLLKLPSSQPPAEPTKHDQSESEHKT